MAAVAVKDVTGSGGALKAARRSFGNWEMIESRVLLDGTSAILSIAFISCSFSSSEAGLPRYLTRLA